MLPLNRAKMGGRDLTPTAGYMLPAVPGRSFFKITQGLPSGELTMPRQRPDQEQRLSCSECSTTRLMPPGVQRR